MPDQTHLQGSGLLSSRRSFLRQGGLATSAALCAGAQLPASAASLAGFGARETLRVGLVGCGGRGSGAAANALNADPDTQLVALGDAFADQLRSSLNNLRASDFGDRVVVDDEHQFVGFDAYKHVIDSCDVVILATSPHFRPLHMEYAVQKGVHLFVEKPVAVDAKGVKRVLEACRVAKQKGLSVVSGLCYRYQFAKQATFERLLGGAIGDITALDCTYNTGTLWHKGTRADNPKWSEMEYQMRNWLYFTWLSGDHIAEQHIHSLDKVMWAMGDTPPAKITASGGRIQRTDPKWGHIYDHFNSVFEWDSGVKAFSSCRQMAGCSTNVSDFAYGTKGVAELQSHRIRGADKWRWRGDGPDDMYQNEHDALFRSIRAGEPISRDGDYMCKSTMLAIAGRMAAYTGQTITWDQAMNSELDLSPPAYDWIELEDVPVAIPGVTKFV
ncbi:MAG: Gfo/Idh/MocA family oxidoreductase [Planctomycetes bacterium]|nr:Gfo/Idh/MocA family oxidoreductase [Planctomycetota bacterium]MBL7007670.1 Gfo/Idh/MocA family oxidoreductase [Planctomycetota bacterium]